jgi:RecB family endonuclease NucS
MNICIDINIVDCEEIAKILNKIKKSNTIIIVGKIVIEYIGRATSYAPQGDRIVLLKPDGSLLIHESSKVEPLNWQPPKSTALFNCIEDRLRIESHRYNPREEVIIDFIDIEFIKACNITSSKLFIIGRESDIVNFITLNPSSIIDASTIVGTDIPTPYGKIDVLLKDEKENLIVVEVKNEKAGTAAVLQLKRYLEYYISRGFNAKGVLVAPSITDEAMAMIIKEGIKYISVNQIMNHIKNTYSYLKFKT